MAKGYSIWARLRGKDEASSVFAKIGRNATRSLGGAGKAIGGIFGKIKGTLTSLPVIGAGIGGIFGIKGLIDWVGEFAAAGDTIAKTSRQAGLSTATFQELQYASGLAGVSTEEFALSMKTLNRSLGDLAANRGPLKELLSKVSPSLFKAMKGAKNTEQALDLMFDALAKVKDPAKRAVLAQAAFGEAGIKMALLTETGTEAIVTARKEFRELGGVLSDEALASTEQYNDSLSRLGVAWGGLKNTFGAAFVRAALPWLGKLTTWFKDNQSEIGAMAQGFAVDLVDGIKSVGEALPGIARGFSSVGSAIGKVVGFVDDVVEGISIWTNLGEDFGDMIAGRAPGESRRKRNATAGSAFNPEVRRALPGWSAARESEWRQAQDAMVAGMMPGGDPAKGVQAARALAGAGRGQWEGLDYLTKANDPTKLREVGAAKLGAEVTVKFENAPKGTRVETRGNAPVRVEVGRRTLGATQ